MPTQKKANPSDLTLRNLRALKKREAAQDQRLRWLEDRNFGFGLRIQRLEEHLRDMDGKKQ